MTTTIKVDAHCTDKEEVVIELHKVNEIPEVTIIQNGESHEVFVYDDRSITISEVTKEELDDIPSDDNDNSPLEE